MIEHSENIRLAAGGGERWPERAPVCECAVCGEVIYKGEAIYDISDEIIHRYCGADWLRQFRGMADADAGVSPREARGMVWKVDLG